MQELRLTIELVPKTSWYDNLRKAMPKAKWDELRKSVYSEYDHQCGICGRKGRLNCHEIWAYDDDNHVQRLKGFIALCPLCHHVKHIGLASILAQKGQLDFDSVVQHFMEVNDCDRKTFLAHMEAACDQWRERSKHNWEVDLGQHRDWVNQ